MNKKAIGISLVFAILVSLCGCQLAQRESGNYTETDQLIGVFVTTESLNLYDADAYLDEYLKDNIGSISNGDTIKLNSKKHPDRLYAALVEKTYQDADGESYVRNRYEFVGIDGMFFASLPVQKSDGVYVYPLVSDGISDMVTMAGGENQGISGTIWMVRNSGEVIYYMNRLYLTADGQVYLVPGNGHYVDSKVSGGCSMKTEEKVTATENGETCSYTFSAEVSIDFANPAETVTIVHMNKQDEEVKRETFQVDNLPEQLVPGDDIAYLIVISESGDRVTRQINQPDGRLIEVFVQLDAQICKKECISVNWE